MHIAVVNAGYEQANLEKKFNPPPGPSGGGILCYTYNAHNSC